MAADPIYVNASQLVVTGVTPLLVVNGASAILEDASIVQESDSGLVTVIERWPRRRRSWRISWDYMSAENIEMLFAVNGQKYTFLFIPPRERHYTVSGHWFASGDGVEQNFQLTRGELTAGIDSVFVRGHRADVHYPIDDDFLDIKVDDVSVGFTLGALGVVTLDTPPADGAVIHAWFHYATPVRFTESIEIFMQEIDLDEVKSATIVEDFEA